MYVTADFPSALLPVHLNAKMMKSFVFISPNTGLPQHFAPLRKHLDRGALHHHGMLESRQSFRDALSASVVEKDSGDLPTRMLLGFPGRFAFCSPCYV